MVNHRSVAHKENAEMAGKGQGTFSLSYNPTGPKDMADDNGYMRVLDGRNYYVQQRSEGLEVTESEKGLVEDLIENALAHGPKPRKLEITLTFTKL